MGHRPDMTCPVRAALLAAAFAAALALGGCGGVEFQGKIFDYMGVSGERKEPDVRMSERPPLLLPPDTKALPQPGSGVATATARQDWPQNPEKCGRSAPPLASNKPKCGNWPLFVLVLLTFSAS